MGKSGRFPFSVGIFCLVLAINGCMQPQTAERVDASGGGPASASAAGDNGDGTYNAPEVPPGPGVFVAYDAPFSAYNNRTAETDDPNNTAVLNQVLADPFIVDGDGNFLLNSDVMESAKLTSQDPQVVTYKIKPNIKWSDGEAWDCDDFYLAWLAGSGKTTVRGPDGNPIPDAEGSEMTYFTPSTTRGYEWANAECRDDLTFVETYQAPYVDWRRNYIQNAILPAHVLERMAGIPDITALGPQSPQADLQRAGEAWNSGWTGFHADTTPASGPYRIESSQPGERTVLVRNEQWAARPGGPEWIVLVPVPDAAAVQGLPDQQFNVVTPPADPVLADRLRALADQGVVLEIRGGSGTENLDLNLASPLFQDPVVRTAFAQCVDRNQLVEKLVRGVSPAAQPLGSLVFLPDDADYEDHYSDKMPADAQLAQLTLERAGWQLGRDGVYSRNGQRLSFVISHDGSPNHTQAVELIRAQCRLAGMEIGNGPVPDGFGKALAEGAFDAALTTNSLVPRLPSLTERYGTSGANNHQSYLNPKVNDALAVAEREYSEPFQTEALLKADRLIAEDLVTFPLYQIPIMWAYSSNIDSVFRHGSDGVTWNANEWEVS
jgi:peptide/nickel transport system substrate-binding protein